MAQMSVHGNWKSIFGLASLVTMILGFWSKEDHVAIGGIMGLFTIVILDIILRIGLLGFTECKQAFSALTGCP